MIFEIISVFVGYSEQVLPWFLAGLVLAVVIEKRFSNKTLPKYFCEYRPLNVAVLLLLGMISPFSILSGLPLALTFLRQGAHPALLLSFFAAERVYDLHSFPIIGNIFGWEFAVVNAIIVFVALFVATWSVRTSTIAYHARTKTGNKNNEWMKHAKMLLIVMAGIAIAATFRVLVQEDAFLHFAGGLVGGTLTALFLGSILYLGTIDGNYPLAGAFSELGMHGAGLMTFLSASSLLNVVIVALFASSISPRVVAKYFLIYGAVATILSVCFGVFVY